MYIKVEEYYIEVLIEDINDIKLVKLSISSLFLYAI